ncbi:response regulator [Crenobacter caeni]|uniref:Sensory/regulatory protein RpfC n=1 Tax=Crenobacter caeni TaxID=2705474 RepID=A0A6B2KUK2_9NEIS|nr:response regulator [Crenobacter caeni]NDV13926.1 response regulator [Crenobacter caeni]
MNARANTPHLTLPKRTLLHGALLMLALAALLLLVSVLNGREDARFEAMARASDAERLIGEAREAVAEGGLTLRELVMAAEPASRQTLVAQLTRSDADASAALRALSAGPFPVQAADAEEALRNYWASRSPVIALSAATREGAWRMLGEDEAARASLTLARALDRLSVDAQQLKAGVESERSQAARERTWLLAGAFALFALLVVWSLWSLARALRAPRAALGQALSALADGDFDWRGPPWLAREYGELSAELGRLREQCRTSSAERWVLGALSNLSSVMQRASSLSELGRTTLSALAPSTAAVRGAFYLDRPSRAQLSLLAGYALEGASPAALAYGERLAGQCAEDRQPRTVEGAQGNELGYAFELCVRVWPVLLGERLVGVLELGFAGAPPPAALKLVEGLLPQLAMAVEILERAHKARYLLESTRKQAQQLGEQAEALRQHQVALADQIAFQDALIDTIPYPLFYKGPDNRFLGVNRAYEAALGVRRQDMLGKTVLELAALPEDERERYQAEDTAVIAGCSRLSRERSIRFADGADHDTLYWVAGFCHADGRAAGLVGSFVDISERKAMETRLREAGERLSLAQQAGRAGVFDLDLLSGHNYWTPELEQVFGLPAGGFAGTLEAWQALLHPDDRAAATRRLRAALSGTCESFEDDWRIVRADGETRWVHVNARILRGEDGRARRVIGINVDVDELVSAREAARSAARAKADFLANMSHEIRTPLNAVLGMAHLALDGCAEPRTRDYLQKVERSGRYLLSIINDILDFSRVESGRLALESAVFSLADVLDNAASLIAGRASDKGLELVVEVGEDVPARLVGDPLRLGQILVNYAGNAVKFTEHGEIVLGVERVAGEGDGVTLRFYVRDTGIGLDAATQKRLFQPFEQADASTTRRYGGTGLGLAIVRRLSQLMGGEAGVDSTPGQGSTFWATARLGVAAEQDTPRLERMRALVADDNESALRTLGATLSRFGVEVETVADGEAALAAVREADAAGRPFDVVLLDWRMPGADGVEVGRRIAALPLARQPDRVLVTAFARDEAFAQADEAGFARVLGKPVSASLLFDTLAHLGEAPVIETPADSRARLTGLNVLVAEDNPLNQEVARGLIERAGGEVRIAGDGAAALAELARKRADVVLMDLQMPGMDGLTATRAIRADPSLSGLPVFAMTASALPEEQAACLAAGMDGIVAKPVEPEALLSTLARVRAARGSTPAAARPGEEPAAAGGAPAVLDRAGALARLGGDAALWQQLAGQFVSREADTPSRVERLIAEGRLDDARFAVHALRGSAANLGAVAVAAAASTLEASLVRGAADGAALAALAAAMAVLPAALAAQQDPVPPAGDRAGLAPATLAALRHLLENDDADAPAWLSAHRDLLPAGAAGAQLAAAIERYDYPAALALLDTLEGTPDG